MVNRMTAERNKARYHKLKENKPFLHKKLYLAIKARANKLPFDLTEEYLESIWTGQCAISGMSIELYNHRNEENHAELDRINPSLGYIQGNVAWTSRRFNRLKGDGTVGDFKTIINYLEKEYGNG